MNRAVIDTNVLVAGFLSPHGPPGRIVDWLRIGMVTAVVDDRIVAEYAEVLARPTFGLPPEEVEIVLGAIRARAEWVAVPAATTQALPDADDAPFLECARAAGVSLVTGNRRHFPPRAAAGVEVIDPATYAARLVAAA